jgi:hypothetical protein
MIGPGRDPYEWVKTALRQEVGFLCPVEGCGNPYLTWHHFDPPWRVEHHHRPAGMIALCRPHADKADNGSFTDEQLRELKRVGKSRAAEVRGRFDWMRQDLLAVVGRNFFYEQRVIFQIADRPCIWFDRDETGYLLLNFKMPTLAGTARAQIEQNFWTVPPGVDEIVCPPNGRLIEVKYANGDKFRAEFFTVHASAELDRKYPPSGQRGWYGELRFPVAVVELWETVAGTAIEFGPRFSRLPGIQMVDGYMSRNGGAGIQLDASSDQLSSLFPDDSTVT